MKKRKIEAEAIYLGIYQADENDKAVSLFRSLFKKTILFHDYRKAAKYISNVNKNIDYNNRYLLVLDCRDNIYNIQKAIEGLKGISQAATPASVIIVFDQNTSGQIYKFGAYGVCYFLKVPWSMGSLGKIFQSIVTVFTESSREKGYKLRVKRCLTEKTKTEQFFRNELDKCYEVLRLKESFFVTKTHEFEHITKRLLEIENKKARSTTDKEKIEFLHFCEEYLNQLETGIRETIDFLSYGDGSENSSKHLFNINTVLDSIKGMVGAIARERGVELIFDIDNNVPSHVEGDPIMVQRVIINMIGAAIDSANTSEIVLKIMIEKSNNREKMLLIELVDTADLLIGTSKEEMLNVLKTGKFALAEEIAETLGGSLGIDIKENEKRVVFALPTEAGERRSYRLPSRKWMSRKILIIEDNEQTQEALKKMLGYFHFNTQAVSSDQDALKLLREDSFDLIMIDENIFDICAAECSARKKMAKIVLLERENKMDNKGESIRKMMADAVLSKPFTQQRIFNIIMEVFSMDNIEGTRETLEALKKEIRFSIANKKVLYISGNPSDRDIAQTLMKDTGINYKVASRLIEVAAEVSSVDMVFLDSELYETEEWERVIKDCKKLIGEKEIAVAAVLPQTEDTYLEIARNLGISSFLYKPIEPEKFYRILLDHLRIV